MNTTSGVQPVPWAYLDHEILKRWIWRTDHFEAVITADINSFHWLILDLVNSPEGVTLAEGRLRTYAAAEAEVRETAAKSYPLRYGYRQYAGPLATTFTVLSGERVDFGPYTDQTATVTVRQRDGEERDYTGRLSVVHYEVWLHIGENQSIRIQPAHITNVTTQHLGATATPARDASHTGIGRLHTGKLIPGCTGVAGFLPDTVDHTGPTCPVHETVRMRSV